MANNSTDPVSELLSRLCALADKAYYDYSAQSKKDECLGWEIKVEKGKFGSAELEAHIKRGEYLGWHRALHVAMKMVQEELRHARRYRVLRERGHSTATLTALKGNQP